MSHLIRATFLAPESRLWGITFASEPGEKAAEFAERLCPKKHKVMVVKTLRPLDLRPPFQLTPAPAHK